MVSRMVTEPYWTSGDCPPAIESFVAESTARWSRLWALIERYDHPPAPYRNADEARSLLLAVLYRALTDVAWDSLPAWTPPPAVVQATYQRWHRLGLLRPLADELLIQLDGES